MLHRLLIALFGIVFATLFGVVFNAQILSFLRLYTPTLAILGTIIFSGGAAWVYFRTGISWHHQLEANSPADTRTQWIIAGCVLVIVALVFVVRMSLWPYSSLGENIHFDVTSYHLPKAIELYRTGGMWTFEIPYGQYPVGFESFAALSIMVTGEYYGMGVAQAMMTLYLFLTLYLLLRRYTTLPSAWLLLLAVCVCFVPTFYSQILVVGKNDVLLATTVLAALLHAPLSNDRHDRSWHAYGLAFTTMLSLSVKANGLVVLAGLWLVVFWRWWQAYRVGQMRQFLSVSQLVMLIVIMFPGGLWVIRNLMIMGRPYSPEVSGFFSTTWLANLFNPVLYSDGAQSVAIITLMVVALLTIGLPLFIRRLNPWFSWVLALSWLAILMTPLGVFRTTALAAVHIEWRYTLYVWWLLYVLLIVLATPFLGRFITRLETWSVGRRTAEITAIAGTIMLLLWLDVGSFLEWDENNLAALQAPANTAPGADGYKNVYDFVQREIHDAVVYYDDYTAFFGYDPAFSNHLINHLYPLGLSGLLDLPEPDCVYYFDYDQRSPYTPALEPANAWDLLYDDGVGRVYCSTSYVENLLPTDIER